MRNKMGHYRQAGLGLVLVLAACEALSVAGAAFVPAEDAATDADICDYSSSGVSVVGHTHARQIFIDYERRGFFRIGFLPLLVIEDVRVEIRSAENLTNALDDLRFWPQSGHSLRQVELRNLDIVIAGEKQPRLHAAVARFQPNGGVELSGVSVAGSSGTAVSLARAVLEVAGPAAGKLCWNRGPQPESLFVLSPKKP